MFARKIIPTIPASQSRDDGPDARYSNPFPLGSVAPLVAALDLNARLRDLETKLARWHAETDAAAIDAIEDAREIAAIERQEQIDADELAGEQDARNWFPTPPRGV